MPRQHLRSLEEALVGPGDGARARSEPDLADVISAWFRAARSGAAGAGGRAPEPPGRARQGEGYRGGEARREKGAAG